MVGLAVDPSFIDEARKRFTAESAYLDDRPVARCASWPKPI